MSEKLVSDLMSTPVHTITADRSLTDLAELFDRFDVRHVPVVDAEGDIVGLVSDRDLLRNVLTDQADVPLSVRDSAMQGTLVETIMTEEVVTLEPNETAQKAARTMLENKFGCIPVTEGARLVGIITQSDFLRLYATGGA
ncbi:MAG: CBS domain-containing protein [Acidobacteriota bacterium]